MQKLPILHLRDMSPRHLEFISRELSKPTLICTERPLSPVTAFLVPVSNPGSSYLHGSHFRIWAFFGSPLSPSTHYSIFYLDILLQSTPPQKSCMLQGLHEENQGMQSGMFSTLLSLLEKTSPIKVEYCLLLKKFDEKVLG